jgi:MutS domain V
MHRGEDFDAGRDPPFGADALVQDLELETLLQAMARGDALLLQVARCALLAGLGDPDGILYRQRVLADCLEHPEAVRRIFEVAGDAGRSVKKVHLGWFRDSPDSILHRSVKVLEILLESLRTLRGAVDEHAAGLRSEGFTRFCAMIAEELDDDYLATVEYHLGELRFRRGVLLSAGLGAGNTGIHHTVRTARERRWTERLAVRNRTAHSFRIPDRDENGFRALGELRGRGINSVANALAQSTDHILGFFAMLQTELAFYVGCLNLHEQLTGRGEPVCLPVPAGPGTPVLTARGLYDPCLALSTEAPVRGNDVDGDGMALVVITGANQGGKSTFLRSAGVAQLMLQCGMFVAAESYTANVCDGVFTHFTREEDATMRSGKLDEELSRMSEIADAIAPGSMLLCNESFAATNEREGSEIARQVVRALVERGVRVFFVTHLYDLAHGFCVDPPAPTLFLRAERGPDGRRTHRLVEGDPLPTSHGEDSYRKVFGTGLRARDAAASESRR